MQKTSDLYKALLSDPNHWTETRLSIGENGRLITKSAERITFGGLGILIGASGADSGYDETVVKAISTETRLFSGDTPEVGACAIGKITVHMVKPIADIPRRARLAPYVRLTDGKRWSEWLPKGVYYVDTRSLTGEQGAEWITLKGYDAMRMAEQDYPSSNMAWPAKDIDILREIAEYLQIQVDQRTLESVNRGYQYSYPAGYSIREILSYIGASYAGSFIISDSGELRLVRLGELPRETRYLVVSLRDRGTITFGGDRILV